VLLDTTVLIDMEREASRSRPGRATAFLTRNATERLYISVITVGEFAEGFPPERTRTWQACLAGYAVVPITASIAQRYAAVSRELRACGQRLGDNDLWIAATALDLGLPLVTDNDKHFARVPDLKLIAY
jgi:predicted nucleic acid-binding protein